MFIGHFAAGFAAKRWAPKAPLGLLLLAPVLLDLLWPVFNLAGVERFTIRAGGGPFDSLVFDSYPWSHSLLMALVWGALLGWLYKWRSGDGRGARVVALLVVSHWVLDWITHFGDMPLWPGGPRTGLALWRSVPATVLVESAMLAAGAVLYFGATRSRDWIGTAGAWGYLLMLAGSYALSILAPPPPVGAERLVAIVSVASVVLLPLASWIDHHRKPITVRA